MTGIREAILGADYLRRAPALFGGEAGHKEWLHFCVYGPEVDALVNVSLVDDVRPGAAHAEYARLVVLVRDAGRGGWDGDVDLFDPAEVFAQGGGVRVHLGRNKVYFDETEGVYRIDVRLRRRDITVSLTLTPTTLPSLANNIQLDPGPPINWMVLPRMRADGEVRVGSRAHRLRDAPAYHDHNWGRFAWGRDFAWEWGFGLPQDLANPWSVVFVRLSNRAHTRVFMQALFLWRGATQHRVIRAGDVRVRRAGFLRAPRVFKVPRAMALVSPGTATDVPASLHIEAEADGDLVRCDFAATDLAQVIIPNDHDAGVTIIHEVSGSVRVGGTVRGERVEMEGRAIFEFLGA
jgi:hypothetical protein